METLLQFTMRHLRSYLDHYSSLALLDVSIRSDLPDLTRLFLITILTPRNCSPAYLYVLHYYVLKSYTRRYKFLYIVNYSSIST